MSAAAAAKRTVPAVASVLVVIAVSVSGTAGGAPKRDRQEPTTPVNLAVVRATDSLVEVSWDAAQDNVGVVGYDVWNETQRTRVSGTTYAIRGLACGSSAAVAVAAVDAAGNRSARAWLTVSSAACVDRQPPSTPSGFVQEATTEDSVVLRWSPSIDNVGVVSYRIYRGLVTVSNSIEPVTTLTGLACDSTYAFVVDAADAAGNRSGLGTAYVQTAGCTPTVPPVPVPIDPAPSDWSFCANENDVCSFSGAREVRYGANATWTSPRVFRDAVPCSNEVFGDPVQGVVKRCESRPASSGVPVTDTSPPAKPVLSLGPITQTSAVLNWKVGLDNVGVDHYDVWLDSKVVAQTTSLSYTYDGLKCGASYTLGLEVVDAAGNKSPLDQARWTIQTQACSPSSGDTSPPVTPILSLGPITQTSAILNWKAGVDNVGVHHYNVWLGSKLVAQTTSLSYTYDGLTCGSSYTLGLEVVDAAGNKSPLDQARWTIQTQACSPSSGDTSPPAKPILSLGSIKQTSATLNWKPGVDNVGVDHYNVWLGSKIVAQTTSLSYTYDGLTCGSSYTLGLEVVDAAGNKSPLDQALWTIQTQACSAPVDANAPSAPGDLSVTAAQQSKVSLGWAPAQDDTGVVGYGVYENTNNVLVATQTAATVGGLACGTAYAFAVDARDAAGNHSSKASVVGATAACSDSRAPSAPTNVVATSRSATSIAISWTPSTDDVGVAGYGLYRDGTRVDSTPQTTAIFSGLACNRNYTLAVDAFDAAGNRSSQGVVMVSTTVCPDMSPPTGPSGLEASSVTQTSLVLGWSASSDNIGVAGYDVYKNGMKVATQATTAITMSGLVCGTSYAFAVVARDAAGNASPQAQLSVSTAACATAPPPPSQPPASTQSLFDGGFDTGDTSQWDYVHRYTTDRYKVVASDGGVSPRQGSHMARVEVRPNEGASWDSSMNVSMAQKSGLAGASRAGDDVYTGFSLYLPNGYSYVPNTLANNIMEWHGNSSTLQAPVHFGVDGYSGKFAMDLHTQSGWNPTSFSFGDVIRGRWVDFVIHTKWAKDSSGIVEGWMDGQKMFSSSRQTWYSSGIDSVYPMLGYYRANYSQTATFYVDAFKVGTSYQSVAP